MYVLQPDSTFSSRHGSPKGSDKSATRSLAATRDTTGHASRWTVCSGMRCGGRADPCGPGGSVRDPGRVPGGGRGLSNAMYGNARPAVRSSAERVESRELL